MAKCKRFNVKAILADEDLRRKLMVSTIQTTQAREGIETTEEQAQRAYYVVSEGERASFFDLVKFRSGKEDLDRRHEMFVRSIRNEPDHVRFDVARRDFESIDGVPLAYQRVGYVAHIFREMVALEPAWGIARQGKATGDDSRWVRQWWEVLPNTGWVPFAKGGEFCRFYSDVDLVIDWKPEHREDLKTSGNALPSLEHYFKSGLSWPLRTQRGFNLRVMPKGCIFGHKGPAIFPKNDENVFYILGIANSIVADYLLRGLASFGSWEVGVIKRLPIPETTQEKNEMISGLAKTILDAKAKWDSGNSTSTRFVLPWILQKDVTEKNQSIPERLDRLATLENLEDARIQMSYAELNDEVFRLYGIPENTRRIIDLTLGDRPVEAIWPQMERKTAEQKRLEHVWRLLSYLVDKVVRADEDGIVPYMSISGEQSLLERVRNELRAHFPDQDINRIEVEIANELKRKVKGYQSVEGIERWLSDVYFDYHVSLYNNRPIFWHIAGSQGRGEPGFGALVHYHKFDKDRLAKLRGSYIQEVVNLFRREAALAGQEGRIEDRQDWQAKLEEVQELDRRLQLVQEGHFPILTPWKSPAELPTGWDPDPDDGIKVNIEPLQRAGVLRIGKVV